MRYGLPYKVESPMAVLVDVREVCGAIRSEYHIYEEVKT